MIEVHKVISAGNRFFNLGYWDEAESCYERAIQICDFHINLFRRDRKSLVFLRYKIEAVSRMAEIAESLRREDDAERFLQLGREIFEYLHKEARGLSRF